jgi:hypothetical protein
MRIGQFSSFDPCYSSRHLPPQLRRCADASEAKEAKLGTGLSSSYYFRHNACRLEARSWGTRRLAVHVRPEPEHGGAAAPLPTDSALRDFFDRKVRTQVGLINFLKRVSKLS